MNKNRVAILIKIAALEFDKIANPVFSKYDITASQYRVLKFLYSLPDASARIVDIEEECAIRHPTVLGLIGNLEKNGFVTKIANPDDARSKLVALTPKARDMQVEIEGIGDKLDNKLTESLSDDEKQELILLLRKLLKMDRTGEFNGI